MSGTAHGLSPRLAVLDEIGQVRGPHDAFIEAIETAQAAHNDPLLFAISTQATTDGDLFSIWLDDAAVAGDKTIVSYLHTAPKDCKVLDREAWNIANHACVVRAATSAGVIRMVRMGLVHPSSFRCFNPSKLFEFFFCWNFSKMVHIIAYYFLR